jgi:hypothetical protein
LPPPIILQAFQELRERFERQHPGGVPTWFAALPADAEHVAEALRECARKRAAEEAYRLANHRLWDALPPSAGQVQRRDPTATRAEDPRDWRDALCREAERVCLAAEQTAACAGFHREAVAALFDAAHAEITADSYVKDLEFSIDFHGRDLLKAFREWLVTLKVPLSYERLSDELIPVAVRLYAVNRAIYGKDNFLDLANGVRSLVGLAPLT